MSQTGFCLITPSGRYHQSHLQMRKVNSELVSVKARVPILACQILRPVLLCAVPPGCELMPKTHVPVKSKCWPHFRKALTFPDKICKTSKNILFTPFFSVDKWRTKINLEPCGIIELSLRRVLLWLILAWLHKQDSYKSGT